MSDDFVQSMTFVSAGEHIRSCDCDECDNLPWSPAMVAAIRERKRQRLAKAPIKRTQHRELVERLGSVSLYRLTMPVTAAPLVEFGNSHRVLWIERKPQDTVISSIGKGIIGSSDEESSRICLKDWKEGSVILVPSNGGKAVGWLHEYPNDGVNRTSLGVDSSAQENCDNKKKEKDKTTNVPASPVVIYVAKVPSDKYQEIDSKRVDDPLWVKAVLDCCRQGLQELKLHMEGNTICQYIEITKREADSLKHHIRNLLSNNA
jgi:hypothetical protein